MKGVEPIEIRDDGDGGQIRPWDRQPGERVKDYKLFLIFRDMEPIRSVVGAYRRYVLSAPEDTKSGPEGKLTDDKGKKKISRLSYEFERISRKYQWAARADEWDLHVELENRKARLSRRLKQSEEFERFELGLLQKGFKRHSDLVELVDATGLDKLGGHLQKTAPLWRRNLGLPAVDATVETRDVTDQDPVHLQLADLVDEICRRTGLPPAASHQVSIEDIDEADDDNGDGHSDDSD